MPRWPPRCWWPGGASASPAGAGGGMSSLIPLDAITLDPELQPRVSMDRAVMENYAQLVVDGVTLPPVTVFNTGQHLLLADEFQRWHVHNTLQLETSRTEVIIDPALIILNNAA